MEQKPITTVDELRTAYPDLVNQIEAAAAAAATAAERNRIQSIENIALPGSEELTANAKFGEQTMTAEQYAMALLKDAKSKGATYLNGAKDDAEDAGGVKNDKPGEGVDSFMQSIRAINKDQ